MKLNMEWYWLVIHKFEDGTEVPDELYKSEKKAEEEVNAFNEIIQERAREEGITRKDYKYIISVPLIKDKGTYTYLREFKEAREAK